MKRFLYILTILMTLLFSSVSSWAASCPVDSILTFNIDSVLTEVTVFAYDDAGHTISEIVWTVNADGTRTGKSKKEDRYEGNTLMMTSTYVWDNTIPDWIGDAKTEYEYTNGKKTATTVFDWLNGDWSAKSKETYVYDAAGRETEYTTYARNSAGQLEYVKQRKKTYNSEGKLILDIQSTYTNGAWVGSFKYVYDYNALGTQTLYEYYSSYTNGAWVGSTRNYYEFDAAGNKTLEEKYSGMTGGVWKGSSKYTAKFNTNKKEIEKIVFKWVTSTKKWQENTKTTKEYDGNNVIDEASYTWSNGWVGKTRTSKTYSNPATEIAWKWSNGWVHNTKTETQYDGSNIRVQTKSVWKNSAWVNVSQLTNTYVSNRLTEANTKAWRNGTWQDSVRTVNTYDSKNINTLSVSAAWNGADWISTDSTTREITYTTIGSKEYALEDVSMKWTSASGKWAGVKRETKEYDTSGNVILWDTYSWVNNTGWVSNARHHYAYKDGNKNLETLNDYLTWNQTTNVWVGISRTEKGYDATNRQVKTSTYSWNSSHNDWEGLSSSEDVYENGIKVTSYSYKWDYTDWDWVGMFKHDYTYEGSKIKEQIDWRYNKTTGWYYNTRVTNTYDSKGRTIKTVNYQWVTAKDDWCMTSTNQTTYDADADGGRLREQLDATGSNCEVTTYALKHYMYGCDRIIIRFVNYDGTILDTQILEKGVTPEYKGAMPTHEGGIDNYTFIGWSPEIVSVTGSATYTAVFKTNTYTIIFKNGDEVLQSSEVAYNETPNYTGKTPTKDSDAQFSYEFAGWSPVISAVSGDATYQAMFDKKLRTYTITFKNGDEVLHSSEVEYGVIPKYDGDDPTKAADAHYTYTFAGWDKTIVAATGNATYTATYTKTTNSYTITWLNDDGSLIDETTVEYNVVPTHADATKARTDEFTYTFDGWDKEVVAVTGEATYTATFTASKNSYTITWLNDDGSLIDQTTVEYNVVPTHADATKARTDEFTYSFAGWDKEVVAVTGEATYTATFTESKNTYTITWLNDDGSLIDQTTVEYNVVPEHDDATKARTDEFSYTFAGWDKEVVAVTGEATYTATFTASKNSYTITWLYDDGSLIDQTMVEYNVVPEHDDPIKPQTAQYTYTFANWDKELVAVTGEATYTATFTSTVNSYTITWLDDEGNLIDETTVEYGVVPAHDDLTKPQTAQYTYTFANWDKEVVSVTGDATYSAVFESTVNSYTVIFKNGDEVLQSGEVEYGVVPKYEGDTPKKDGDAVVSYVFAGWDKEVVSVTGDATYTATFTSTANTYTITWLNSDNSPLSTMTLEYGAMPKYEGDTPTKEADAQYTYTFAGWDKEVVSVSGDATYTATFTGTLNTYTITFYYENGVSIVDEVTVPYGEIPSTPFIPSYPSDEQYYYTFAGWVPTPTPVTGNASYIASYNSVARLYTITFRNYNGKQLQSEKLEYGETPVYLGETPTKPSNNLYRYEFSGWTPELTSVTGDAVYTATYLQVDKYEAITDVEVSESATKIMLNGILYIRRSGKIYTSTGTLVQ